ncbi:MAG: DUF4920 domain-containing protein [Cyclobacteriaceae bacterium]
MRLSLFVGIMSIVFLISCSSSTKEYQSFGDVIGSKKALDIKVLDEVNVASDSKIKLTGTVSQVCQAKGCWMTLDTQSGVPLRVKFKDYAFFVPKDISGRRVIVEGTISKKELDLESAKHFAEDAGEPFDDTKELLEYAMIASGVLIEVEE